MRYAVFYDVFKLFSIVFDQVAFLLAQVVLQIGVFKHTSDFIVLHVLNVDEIAEFFEFAEDHLIELQYLSQCDYVVSLFQLQHAHQGSHDEIETSYVNISFSNRRFTQHNNA